MADVEELDRLLGVLDRHGLLGRALSVRHGGLAVELQPKLAEQAAAAATAKDDPQAPKRAHYENLLGRPVLDEDLARLP